MQISKSNKFLYATIKQVFVSVSLGIIIISIGVLGFIYIEGYSFIDALYFTIITISTVGYSEVRPLDDDGKLFTIALILGSMAVLGYTLKNITELFLQGYLNKQIKTYQVRKKIEKLTGHTIVCGYGRNGFQACRELMDHNQAFVVIDNRDSVIDRLQEDPNNLYIQGDASSEEILALAEISKAKALITALENDADNMYVVLTARGMNPKLKIISRASNFRSDLKLKRAGADNVIMPDRIGGQRMAKLVVQEDVVEFMEFMMMQRSHSTSVQKVSCTELHPSIENKSLKELKFRARSGMNIIGFKNRMGMYICNPAPEYIFTKEDEIFALGTPEQLALLKNYLKNG